MIQNNEIITSRNNPKVKWASSLVSKKGRDESKSFIAEGEKLTMEALSAHLPVSHIIVCESKKEAVFSKLSVFLSDEFYENTELLVLGDGAFSKISTENSPQGVISVIKYLDFFKDADIIYNVEKFLPADERALILSSIRDPGNLGAVIRSATAFGVDHIILSSDSCDLYNPKTVRSAMGSLFRIKCSVVTDVVGTVKALVDSGRRVFAAELTSNAKSISELGIKESDVFIIGNEGHGISQDISSVCTGSAYIPISKKTESLNAAVAAAIFMWEQTK